MDDEPSPALLPAGFDAARSGNAPSLEPSRSSPATIPEEESRPASLLLRRTSSSSSVDTSGTASSSNSTKSKSKLRLWRRRTKVVKTKHGFYRCAESSEDDGGGGDVLDVDDVELGDVSAPLPSVSSSASASSVVRETTAPRWSQYDDSPTLSAESAEAHASAVADAAERAALRQVAEEPRPETTGESVLVLTLEEEEEGDKEKEGRDVSRASVVSADEESSSNASVDSSRRAGRFVGRRRRRGPIRTKRKSLLEATMGSVAPHPSEEAESSQPSPSSSSLKRGESARIPSKLKRKWSRRGRRAVASSLASRSSASEDEIDRNKEEEKADGDGRDLKKKEKRDRKIRGKAVRVLELAEGGTARTRRRERVDFGDDDINLLDSMRIPEAGADGWSDGSRFSIDDGDYDDGEGVDVVGVTLGGFRKKKTTTAAAPAGRMDDVSLEDEDDADANTVATQKRSNLRSSCYSVQHPPLLGADRGDDDDATAEGKRRFPLFPGKKWIRNMLQSSPYAIDRWGADAKSWLPSSSSSSSSSRKTIWTDADLRSGNCAPLPSTTTTTPGISVMTARHWIKMEQSKAKRRKMGWAVAAMACVACLIGVVYGTARRVRTRRGAIDDARSASDTADPAGNRPYEKVGERLTFAATADVPYDRDQGESLARELTSLPPEIEFLVHLGGVSSPASTSCEEGSYEDAKAVLKTSPAPAFIIPGTYDWNGCDDPDAAWTRWDDNLNRFETNFANHGFDVRRDLKRDENFSFLRSGVLFLGLNLVDAASDDDVEERNVRHEDDARWTEEILSERRDEEYRAIVIFGHAWPGPSVDGYFQNVLRDIRSLGKPTLYLHSHGGDDYSVPTGEYLPYPDVEVLTAKQVDDGGAAPLAMVTIDFGDRPFHFSS